MHDQVKRARRALKSALAAVALVGLTGCYGYAYQGRSGPKLNPTSLDAEANSSTRWSYLWGLFSDEWSPTKCVQNLDGTCKSPPATCVTRNPDGTCPAPQQSVCPYGVGRVEVGMPPYSVLLMGLTLGIVMPVRMLTYCSAQAPAPDSAPVDPPPYPTSPRTSTPVAPPPDTTSPRTSTPVAPPPDGAP